MKNKILLLLLVTTFSISAQKDSISENKKIKFIGIPVINYSNSFGASFGGLANAYYHLKKSDTISPLSSSSIYATYATNKTWFAVQVNKFYLNEDKIRIKSALGLGTINFQTYLEYPNLFDIPLGNLNSVDEGVFVDYQTDMQFAYGEFLYRIIENFYLGGQVVYSHSKTTFDVMTNPTEEVSQIGVGLSSELDSRNSQFSPTKGNHASFSTMSFFEDLGSTNSYTNLNIVYNHYFSIGKRNTVLARFYGDIAIGDVPFSGQNVVGRDDLRGYSNGKYRGDQVYAAQSEYRHWFSDRWGYVAFAGVATAINTTQDLGFNNLLPAAGAGIRFLAIRKSNISIGIDVAVGKDDWGLYFRIGEAFTK